MRSLMGFPSPITGPPKKDPGEAPRAPVAGLLLFLLSRALDD